MCIYKKEKIKTRETYIHTSASPNVGDELLLLSILLIGDLKICYMTLLLQ